MQKQKRGEMPRRHEPAPAVPPPAAPPWPRAAGAPMAPARRHRPSWPSREQLYVLGFLAGALALLFTPVGDVVSGFLVSQIPVERDLELGLSAYRQLPQLHRQVPDSWGVASLGRELSRAHPASRAFQFRFAVLDDPTVNACALPGGFVFVNRGLLERGLSEGELAGVLAHEIGHVVRRHSQTSLVKSRILQLLFAALVDVFADADGDGREQSLADGVFEGLLERGRQLGGLAFSRRHEYEADDTAVDVMAAAGVNPKGLIAFFRRLLRAEGTKQSGMLGEWERTHPYTANRIDVLQERIAAARTAERGRAASSAGSPGDAPPWSRGAFGFDMDGSTADVGSYDVRRPPGARAGDVVWVEDPEGRRVRVRVPWDLRDDARSFWCLSPSNRCFA